MAQRTTPSSQPTRQQILATAMSRAEEMSSGSRRESVPIRSRFIRDVDAGSGGTADTPMRRLVTAGGREGITLRLYLALLWRCSAAPYETTIPAQQWAELLALEPPVETYSRRVASAITRLEAANLISVKRERGKTSVITLLDESGDGSPYEPPSGGKTAESRWVKVPISLWQTEQFHGLGTPGLAMMLAILAESNDDGRPVWWSVSRFEKRIGITPSTRARGVKELSESGLLTVGRRKVSDVPGRFSREAVRHTYKLHLEEPLQVEGDDAS